MKLKHVIRAAGISAGTGIATILLVGQSFAAPKVSLKVATWDGGDGLKVIQEACNQFTKKNPNISIKVESWGGYQDKLLVSLGAGTAPDVFMLGEIDVGTFCYTGFIQSLNGFIKQDKMDLSGLRKVLQRMYIAKGELYGLPKDYAPFAVYYNKALLDQAGLQYPKSGWHWNDLIAMGKKLTKFDAAGKVTQTGFNFYPGNAETHVFLSTMGAAFMAPDKEEFKGYLDSPATAQAIQFMADMKLKEHLLTNGADFGGGKVGLSLQGPWSLATYIKKKNFNYGIVAPPIGKRQGGCILSAAWCMSTATKHKNEAWKLVKFLGGPEGNTIMGKNQWALPSWKQSIKELKIESDPNLSQLLDASEEAETIAPIEHPFYDRVVAKHVYPAIQNNVWAGKKTAIQALAEVTASADKDYARYLKTQPKIIKKR